MPNFKTVVIVEGPAGSGKSTLIRTLQDRWGYQPAEAYKVAQGFPNVERPRAYEGSSGLLLSAIKDDLTTTAMANYTNTNTPLVADRWFMSQWVYRQIRQNEGMDNTEFYNYIQNFLPGHETELLTKSILCGAQGLIVKDAELRLRRGIDFMGETETPQNYLIYFVVVMPDAENLAFTRTVSHRQFAYPILRERLLFNRAGLAIDCVNFELGNVVIKGNRFPVYGREGLEYLPEAVHYNVEKIREDYENYFA